MDRKSRLALILALLFAALAILALATALIVVFVVVPKIKERVLAEARTNGIELGFDDLELGLSHVSIQNARFRLIGVRGLVGSAKRIDVTTKDFEPTGLHLEQLHLELLGSVPSLTLELSEWTKNYPNAYQLPFSADPVSVRWRSGESEAPWLVLAGGRVGRTEKGGDFQAKTAIVSGISVGTIKTSWTSEKASVVLGFGEAEPEKAPVTVNVEHKKPKPTATVALKPTPAEKLADPLGVKLPVEGVTVSSSVELQFTGGTGPGPVTGEMQVTLDGYIPPHPPEIDGFVFGKTTTFSSAFKVSEDRTHVDLSSTEVKAGRFKLQGDGEAQRYPDHARVRLQLKGHLGCVALAGAAADSHLGRTLAGLAKRVIEKTVQGSVAVTVKIDADTRDLDNAKVLKLIGIGCGLKPLRLPTPEELEAFAKELPEFAGKLPDIVGELPPLPSGLPELPSALPKPPPLPLPKIEFKKPGEKEATDG